MNEAEILFDALFAQHRDDLAAHCLNALAHLSQFTFPLLPQFCVGQYHRDDLRAV